MQNFLKSINDSLLFQPDNKKWRFSQDLNDKLTKKYNVTIFSHIPIISDNEFIDTFYIKHATSNKITIYAHGNGGNIRIILQSKIIHHLMMYSSVIIFDYRGYGNSTGIPSEFGLKNDIKNIWNYTTQQLKYKPKDIILFGTSLGTACVTYLCSELESEQLPQCIILQSGFYSLKRLVNEKINRLAGLFLTNKFNNSMYIKKIKEKTNYLPIFLLHSKFDTLINYKHSEDLAKEYGCVLYTIYGTHNEPIYESSIIKEIIQRTSK